MSVSLALRLVLGVFMIDCLIELALISSMVAWLAHSVDTFKVRFDGSTFDLSGEPKNLLVDQGHSSNGAAGTGFVIVGLGGMLALWLRGRANSHASRFTIFFYYTWLAVSALAFLLTLATLAYVFALTNQHSGQSIDVSFASTLDEQKYPLDSWTPQNWFAAVLQLDLANAKERSSIAYHLRLMRGWQYNLIPMFLLQLVVTALAISDAWSRRRRQSAETGNPEHKVSP